MFFFKSDRRSCSTSFFILLCCSENVPFKKKIIYPRGACSVTVKEALQRFQNTPKQTTEKRLNIYIYIYILG